MRAGAGLLARCALEVDAARSRVSHPGSLLWHYEETGTMAHGSTLRRIVTLLVLLMAAAEIFACQLISPDTCIFSSHSTNDSEEGGSGDGCLCCCAHIVVVPPMVGLVPLGFVSLAIQFELFLAPAVPPNRIEHPPRF
jgi:hypothetical protein